jgi:hypothetical protein
VAPAGLLAFAPHLVRREIEADLAPQSIGIRESRAEQRPEVRHLAIACARFVDALAQGPEGVGGLGPESEVIESPSLEDRKLPLRDLGARDLERMEDEAAAEVDEDVTEPLLPPVGTTRASKTRS